MAACGLHRGLLAEGVASHFYYRQNQSAGPLDETFSSIDTLFSPNRPLTLFHSSSLGRRMERKHQSKRLNRLGQHYQTHLQGNDRQTEVFSQAEMHDETWLDTSRFPHQILNLHWAAFAFDYPSFFASLPKKMPIVWTLHDQNPYTGGCHFVTGCERFQQGCGQCPQILGSSASDVSRHSFKIKRAALMSRQLHVVAPCQWMLAEAQKSSIFSRAKSFQHIPYGLDIAALGQSEPPGSMLGSRLLPTILFGAEDLKNARKGVKYAIEAINELAHLARQTAQGLGNINLANSVDSLGDHSKRLRLWTFGKQLSPELLAMIDPAVVVKQWGYVSDRSLQGQLYRAADVFWLPSLEDNQPQTALEAMACGTPVVGFSVGGVPEIVRHNQTGFVVPAKDAKAMALATFELLRDRKRLARLSAAGKLMVRHEFSPQRQANAYLALYEKTLADRWRMFQPRTATMDKPIRQASAT
ncbi:MAG: glycosyltransferase [Pirellulaceae bacterium]|nr:glycosyltransferase [Pirellulaceae bacterium]